MSPPRFYVEGRTWWISRETLLGCFRLPPDSETSAILQFLLVFAAQQAKVSPHSFSALPNRTGLVVTDNGEESGMTAFLRTFHQLVATHLGHRHQATPGPFWCPSGLEVRCLKGPRSILESMVDCLVAPAAANLCERPMDWPGLLSPVESIAGAEITLPRPSGLDIPGTVLPDRITFRLERPPGFEDLSRAQFRARLRRELSERIRQILVARIGPVADIDELQSRDILDRPIGPPARRCPSPDELEALTRHVVADTPAEQDEAARELREFRAAYREAFRRWRRGDRAVVFPLGTWAMGRIHGARVVRPQT